MDTKHHKAKPKFSGSRQLFKNKILEKLTHTHIAIPVSIFISFSLSLFVLAFTLTDLHTYTILTLFGTGLLFFTLIEYLMHRFIYHMHSSEKSISKLQYLIHGIHHEYPKDKSRLAMPPVISVLIALGLLILTYHFMEKYSYAFLSGFIIGYAGYLLVHYITHAYPPPNNSFKTLWINHSIHHYKDSEKAFGVSSPLWDYIFGTMPEKIT